MRMGGAGPRSRRRSRHARAPRAAEEPCDAVEGRERGGDEERRAVPASPAGHRAEHLGTGVGGIAGSGVVDLPSIAGLVAGPVFMPSSAPGSSSRCSPSPAPSPVQRSRSPANPLHLPHEKEVCQHDIGGYGATHSPVHGREGEGSQDLSTALYAAGRVK